MGLLLRLLPLCVVAISLWRIIPALGEGASSLGGPKAITSLNAVSFANAVTGELGAATTKAEGPAYVGRSRLDGWDRPYQLRENGGTIEVVSCGEDGRCGTDDDLIEVVRSDGSRQRLDASFKKPIPREPRKSTKKATTAKPKSPSTAAP